MSTRGSDISNDKEKGDVLKDLTLPEHEGATEEVIVKRYGRLGPLLSKLFASGVEARGVERVPEDERETKNMWNKLALFISSWCSFAECASDVQPPDVVVGQHGSHDNPHRHSWTSLLLPESAVSTQSG